MKFDSMKDLIDYFYNCTIRGENTHAKYISNYVNKSFEEIAV